jgi:flagellar protein FliJ
MNKPFTLQPLLDLMQNRTDEATRQLGQLIAAEQNAKIRLEMLEQYRDEYAQRLRKAIEEGITQLALKNYQDFLGRIEEAISQQQVAVQSSKNNTAAGQAHWKKQHKQMKAIDTLSQRHDTRERHRNNKLEQKLHDEFSNRKYTVANEGNEEN